MLKKQILTNFPTKIIMDCNIYVLNFNETLTNDVVNFEQSLNDFLNIDNIYIEQLFQRMFPDKLSQFKTNASDTEKPFLYLIISISNDIVSTKIYVKASSHVSDFNSCNKFFSSCDDLSEPEFYGDLVYKFKNIVGRTDFYDQFRKIIMRYRHIGYNLNVLLQSACLGFNPTYVNNYSSLFKCTPVGRASDSMMALT